MKAVPPLISMFLAVNYVGLIIINFVVRQYSTRVERDMTKQTLKENILLTKFPTIAMAIYTCWFDQRSMKVAA